MYMTGLYSNSMLSDRGWAMPSLRNNQLWTDNLDIIFLLVSLSTRVFTGLIASKQCDVYATFTSDTYYRN